MLLVLVAALWAVLVGTQLALRPAAPLDETRMLAVAWEMWTRGEWLVPYLNGSPYSHKPPLVVWGIMAGWSVFGVNEIWPRLVPGFFGLGTLLLIARIAQRLWPRDDTAAGLAPLVVGATWLIAVFTGLLYYDMAFMFFAALGAFGTLDAALGRPRRGFAVLAFAIGLGVLTKGPAILLHALFLPLAAPLWAPHPSNGWRRWYLGVVLAFCGGAAVALAWAVPAAVHGGETYAHDIFWGQTADRMVDSFAHRRPIWFYLAALPLMVLPWSAWAPTWTALKRSRSGARDMGVRFGLVWFLPALIAFSLVSGKQAQYLMPSLPGLLLLVAHGLARGADERTARGWEGVPPALLLVVPGIALAALSLIDHAKPLRYPLDHASFWPGWVLLVAGVAVWSLLYGSMLRRAAIVAGSGMLTLVLIAVALLPGMRAGYDLNGIGEQIRNLQQAHVPLAHVGKYHGQFQFAGRLRQGLEVVPTAAADDWLRAHPEGRLIGYPDEWTPQSAVRVEFSQPYRNKQVVVWALR